MPPDAAYVEAQLIDTLRGGVGHARTRLNALQATVNQTVGSLRQRCADTLSQLEAEATRRGQLEVELSAVRERALTFQRRAEAAEDRLRAESLQQPSMKLLPEKLAALREEVDGLKLLMTAYDEQPSPAVVLLSSHSSPASRTPLPHCETPPERI